MRDRVVSFSVKPSDSTSLRLVRAIRRISIQRGISFSFICIEALKRYYDEVLIKPEEIPNESDDFDNTEENINSVDLTSVDEDDEPETGTEVGKTNKSSESEKDKDEEEEKEPPIVFPKNTTKKKTVKKTVTKG